MKFLKSLFGSGDSEDSIGFTYYRYETSEDDAVRPEHAKRHGKIFIYGQEKCEDDFPGKADECRCFDFPLVDEEVENAKADDFFYPDHYELYLKINN